MTGMLLNASQNRHLLDINWGKFYVLRALHHAEYVIYISVVVMCYVNTYCHKFSFVDSTLTVNR